LAIGLRRCHGEPVRQHRAALRGKRHGDEDGKKRATSSIDISSADHGLRKETPVGGV